MVPMTLSALVVLLGFTCGDAYRVATPTRWLQMSNNHNHDTPPRSLADAATRPMLQRGLQSVLALSSAALASATLRPAPAFAGRLESANEKLTGYGLPPLLFVPPGFVPLISEFGRGNIKKAMTNPILIQFCHPGLWVEATTSVNNNGEAGTVSANDYIKGDSAFFFTAPVVAGETLNEGAKDVVSRFLLKSLSQKGDPVEGFKLLSLRKGAAGVDGQSYYLADIAYTLNTEAGFLIGRKGVVSLTSVGNDIQALVSVTTDKRYKNLERDLRDIADSFRVYKLKTGIFAAADSNKEA